LGVVIIRLPNGYGSVYKLSGNRRRPWAAQVTKHWTGDGTQKRYYVGYYKTRSEALAALTDYNKNPIGEVRDKTFGEIYEKWSESKYPTLTRSTVNGYKAVWKRLEVLSEEPMRNIKKSHLQDVVDGMVNEGLSRSTLEKAKTLCVILFDEAMSDDIVDKNYAKLIELPAAKKAQKETFTDMEIKKLERLAEQGDAWAGTIMVLIYTGMRIGELLKLTKFNVDREAWKITGGIKTDAGRDRDIPVHSKIMPYITYWLTLSGSRLITRDGQAIRVDYYRKYLYYPTLDKAGVRRLTPHSTRHTFATLLSNAKVPTKDIQELIGHSDYATTANTYTHPDLEVLRNAIEKI